MLLSPLRILVVEDHDATIHTVAKILSRRGHAVTPVKWAREAIQAASCQTFELLISDIGLPDLDGWGLLLKIREIQPALRAIALTGYGMASDVERSYKAGYDIHLTKPPEWLAIEQAINTLFSQNSHPTPL